MQILPNCLTSYARLIARLGITSTYTGADATVIKDCINDASQTIADYCGRDLKIATYTEYYDGLGETELPLRHWPIVSITSLYDDTDRQYNSDDLLYNVPGDSSQDEYEVLEVNNKHGIIRRIDAAFDNGKSNVKITYVAGYSEFLITPGNNKLDIKEGTDAAVAVTLTSGKYNAVTLAAHIEARLEAITSAAYTVSYDQTIHRFTLAKTTGNFSILWSTGSNAAVAAELADIIGFDSTADDTGAGTYTSDNPVVGVPYPLESACLELSQWNYTRTKEKRTGVLASSRGDEATSFDFDRIPNHVLKRLEVYVHRRIG